MAAGLISLVEINGEERGRVVVDEPSAVPECVQ
jgi:hypothetical protein